MSASDAKPAKIKPLTTEDNYLILKFLLSLITVCAFTVIYVLTVYRRRDHHEIVTYTNNTFTLDNGI